MGDAAGDAPAAAIELRDVTKVFAGSSEPAVDRLSLDVPVGELVVLVGPSGCGKTTTLRMINRLEEPTSGVIRILGEDVRDRPVAELRRQIGYVIQGVGLFPHLTIAENIATVPRLLGWSRDRRQARVDELADLVDLDRSMLDRYPAELSGGQQQRVGVARALAADPPVLLMDEPYSAVDPIVRARLQDELVELHRRLGTTIVLVTHDIDEAIKVGDRIAMLAVGGRLAQYATPGDLLGAPASDFVASFLGGERSLRRLALVPLGDLDLEPSDGSVDDGPSLDVGRTAREALDLLLRSGAASVAVTRDGATVGRVGLATLSGAVRDGDAGPS
jgi:osmoprotectant transport system ATP-binding protein